MVSEGKASKFDFIYLRLCLCGDKNYNNYSNILIISWQSVIPEENHRLATSLCQSLSHTVVSSTPHHVKEYNSQCVLITLLEESPITFIPEVHMSCIRSLDKEELFRGFFNVLRLRPTLQLYPSRPYQFTPIFSEVRGTRSLVLCGCFVDCSLSFVLFSFGHCVVCPSSM
jgi:hypothetical protein